MVLKSSVFQQPARGDPVIVEFNSWEWSGQDKILEAFFATMRSAFRETDAQAQTDALVERWVAFEAWTKFGAAVSNKIEKAVTPLIGTSIAAALLANGVSNPTLRVGGVVIGALALIASLFLSIAPEMAAHYVEVLKAKAGRSPKSLATLKKEIAAELGKLRTKQRPVLVIVDDIDRLGKEEIRLIFQLVKVNTDFPNLVFLLLFPKKIVVDALSEVVADRGDDYLKKIVQVEFDVPHAPRARMLKIFQDDLNRVFVRKSPQMRWDKERITDLFEDYLWPYFTTLRDVKRFIGTFDFYFHGHINPSENVLEVNPIDLLAIEVLRSFDYEAYLAIRDSLGLSSRGTLIRLLFGDEERKEQIEVEIEAITSRPHLTAGVKDRLRGLLQRLFPEGKLADERFMSRAERDLRICHPKHFTKYFEHALDESPTSAAHMHALLGLVARRVDFAAQLRERCKDGTLEGVFEKLELYREEIPVEAAAAFVGGLCDVGDELPEERLDMFNRDPIFEAVRMSYWLLRQLPDDAARARILEDTFKTSAGVAFPVVMVALLEPDQEKQKDREPQLVDQAQLAMLRQIAVQRIAGFAASGRIWSSRHFAKLIYRWRDWTDQATVNNWLEGELTTPERRLDFVVGMLQRSVVNGERVEYRLDGKSLEGFVSLEEIGNGIGTMPGDSNDRKRIEAPKLLRRAIALKKAGRSYSEVGLRGDFDPE